MPMIYFVYQNIFDVISNKFGLYIMSISMYLFYIYTTYIQYMISIII
jgi:hypothetical protein